MRLAAIALAGSTVLSACGSDPDGGERPKIYGGDRPAELKAPATLTDGKQYPLLVVLHGFGASGFVQTAFFGVGGLPAADQALLIAPDGTTNSQGQQFWNADPACCDTEGKHPDDVGYIGGLIEDISADWPVDKKQVFILGHSNGGYMAYRMACERADLIAAIGSLAGNASSTPSTCTPSQKVNVVHMHGTVDDIVPFTGAMPSVAQWAAKNGCGTTRTSTGELDLDNAVTGAETHTFTTDGCPANGAVDLWTMEGSTHVPIMNATFSTTILDWFTSHKR